ncbi:Oligopeptide ABC transporter, periplasmic oligopeptide-binding protein OppA [Alkalibacterium sp. AK22]|uniref:ABC transporter substrate-binding protein n=1 Tax=Alkalibacterium sp. AK22 TaxID=1229520 RepID=UPI000448B0D4|nr:ABC transporter substrate-binding protein [Alkalibacterium sp. AK22]EXJ24053.1 Oligopeptide ABC transporter, periplasmic oligopeptide-binding protein OppA [Alkalibacterium sp. AK22]
MSNWKKSLKYGTIVFASSLLLAACGNGDVPDLDEEASADNGEEAGADDSLPEIEEGDTSTLMVGLTNAPDSFNPFNRPGVAGTWIQRFFYDSLLTMPTADSFEPALGEFETDDNQVFTVTIDPDANWSDGEPITAHDVAFTLNTIAHPEVETTLGTSVAMIEGANSSGKMEDGETELAGVEVLDDKTLTITTKSPVDLAYLSEFLGFNVLIAPEHVFGDIDPVDIPNSEAATVPTVFSGAYKLVEYDTDNYVHLEANPDYYRGAPEIETVYARIMNGTAMITEFQAGNLHMAAGGGIGMVPVQDISLLEDIDGLVVEEHPSFNGQYMIINNERFADPQVRQAFAYALNRELTVENLLDGRGEVLASTYSSASPYKDEDLSPLPYDPDLAREMLEEAGFDFDTPLEFVVPTGNAVREQNGDLIEQWFTEIGVEVNQNNYDFPTWLSMAQDLDYDIGLMGWGHTVDPNIASYVQTGGASNNMGIADPVIDQLLEDGMAGTDFDERFPIYAELQQHLQDEMPIVPLYSDSQFSVQVDFLNGGINEFWAGSLYDLHEWTLDEQN